MDEALEEVALAGLGGPPGIFERLVGVVVAAGADEVEPARELGVRRRP
ncbi:MAG TPA: hypothetical protein VK915_05965 [Gaiellaceae bacterium]|nr:hypothetical protein [Gaiellaceae bacterium]